VWLLGWYAVISLVAFIACAIDKSRAIAGRRRTRERTLHLLSWLGGAAGMAAAMTLLRHKTRSPGFIVITAIALIAHAFALGAWLWHTR